MLISEIYTHPKNQGPTPPPLHGDIILQELIISGRVSIDRLIDQFYADDEDRGPTRARNCVHLAVHHVKKYLNPGYTISATQQGIYSLHTPEEANEH